MSLGNRASFWLFCIILVGSAVPASAGAAPPCVKAVSSKNGHFLVITNAQLVPLSEDHYRVEKVALEVFPKETFINAKDRPESGESYWTNAVYWSVVLDYTDSQPISPCPLSMISDNGQFLIILNQFVAEGMTALRIFQWKHEAGEPVGVDRDRGVLVRDIPLSDVWPANELPTARLITDGTPEWYAGRKLEFSEDNQYLIFTSRFRTTVRIDLRNGSAKTIVDLRLEGIPKWNFDAQPITASAATPLPTPATDASHSIPHHTRPTSRRRPAPDGTAR